MIQKSTLLFISCLLVACGSKAPSARIVDYGIYDAVLVTSGNWKLGIPVTITSAHGLKHQQTVTRVPTESGRCWGFRALLSNPLKDRSITCVHKIDHPEFTVPDGTKQTNQSQELELAPGETITQNFMWFFIEGCEHEFLPGTWTHRVILDGREVIRKEFEVYKP